MKIEQKYKDILFGVVLGCCMCACTAIYFKRGANPIIDEGAIQALYLLTVVGMVFGVMKSRSARPKELGYSFGRALGVSYLLVAVAAAIQGIFISYLYANNIELLPLVAESLAEQFKTIFVDNPDLAESYADVTRNSVTPTLLGFSEWFRILCGALIPALITAICFRKKATIINTNI